MSTRSLRYRLSEPIVVLGTDDVASAVGHALHGAGVAVVLARDTRIPVLRREMSFDDALECGSVTLDGVTGRATEGLLELLHALHADDESIPVTALAPDDLLCLGAIAGIVDARLRRHAPKVDLRPFVPLAIGLGPGFEAGRNVHVAIETAPEATGRILYDRATIPAHGRSALLGGIGRQRFERAPTGGTWTTSCCIGDAVRDGDLVGYCGEVPVVAPLDGVLRGLVRDRTQVEQRMRLLEVDPRGADGQWRGIPPRAAQIAAAVRTVVETEVAAPAQIGWRR